MNRRRSRGTTTDFGPLTDVAEGETLIIVPPFARLDFPSLAAHLLQACAREAGFSVRVLYANLSWASIIGREFYEEVCRSAPSATLNGERQFAPAAFGMDAPLPIPPTDGPVGPYAEVDVASYRGLQDKAVAWAEQLADQIVRCRFRVIGCTVTFEQTCASIALLRRIKARLPKVITILGGGNCEGKMADGLASIDASVDYIFRGESEVTFVEFLRSVNLGERPRARIVTGRPCFTLDETPTPDFSEFFEQHGRATSASQPTSPTELWLLCETSRGCWWGQKQHCTFCGFNGVTMQFREKSAERVLAEVKQFVRTYPTRKICMTDNIMPFRYFKTLLPRLAEEVPGLHIYYEQKANLSLRKTMALRRAGVREIQAGVEALSSPLLARIRKGVTASQNIAMLRYARCVDLNVNWNLLYALPGDTAEDFLETLRMLPLLRHLQPPTGFHPLTIDRFSPYFDQPECFGIQNIRPIRGYYDLFPAHARIHALAYHFEGEYRSASREDQRLTMQVSKELEGWRRAWNCPARARPTLVVHRLHDEAYVLIDKRGLPGARECLFLDRELARRLLVGCSDIASRELEWAVKQNLLLSLDSRYVPLATAHPLLLLAFESESEGPRRAVSTGTTPSTVHAELPRDLESGKAS